MTMPGRSCVALTLLIFLRPRLGRGRLLPRTICEFRKFRRARNTAASGMTRGTLGELLRLTRIYSINRRVSHGQSALSAGRAVLDRHFSHPVKNLGAARSLAFQNSGRGPGATCPVSFDRVAFPCLGS